MNAQTFEKILESRLEKTRAVLAQKAVEYAPGCDRLHSFKAAAMITGETPAQVCVGLMVKHLVSVLDIVKANAERTTIRSEQLDEKIGDAVNYLILLEAILREKV